MKMKLVILDGYTENPGDLSWEGLEALSEVTVYDRTPFENGNEEIIRRAKGAPLLLVNKTPLSADTLKALSPELRYIGVLATGYNVVDVTAAKELGIPVCNIPTYGTTAVAQFTFALLLEMCHHVGDHNRSVKNGDWCKSADFCYWNYPLTELAGKTMGLVGYGRIGRTVAKIAVGFGLKVLFYDPYAQQDEWAQKADMDEVLKASDVISLHCPLFAENRHIINASTLAKMKDGVMIVNTSRGPLIDENALADALATGKVAFAAVDVVSTEPARKDNPLLKQENCLITPHIAWASKESRQRLMDIAVENVQAFLNEKPQNVVNP